MRQKNPRWIDHNGRSWPVIGSTRALKFCIPSHAAARAYVFHRDGFRCTGCNVPARYVPPGYDGRMTLYVEDGSQYFVVDHVLTRRAGGSNTVDNMQMLCEPCNKRKIGADKAAFKAYMAAAV